MQTSVPVWVVALVIVAAAAAWHLVFVVTGIGQPPAARAAVPPPAPPQLPHVNTDWVDLKLYAARRPVWWPH